MLKNAGSRWMGLAVAAASLIFPASATATAMAAEPAGLPDGVTPFTGRVDRTDVVGGYASTHVIVQVRDGVEPGHLDDGRLTLVQVADRPADDGAIAQAEAAVAGVLQQYGAHAALPTLAFEPANPDLAREIGIDRYYTIRVPAGTDTRGLAGDLRAFDTIIDRAHVDGIGGILMGSPPNDPSFNLQYGLHNTGQNIQGSPGVPGADIGALAAWEIHTGTDNITVAIIDTGVSSSHPDLSSKLVPGHNAIDGSSNTDDSWLISHGTHVAGIAAASTNNGQGIAGVSWGANIMPIKVLNLFGGGTETDIANGVIWAADNGAHIANMSLGVPDGIPFFENACQYAYDLGVLLVAASGNTPGAAIPAPARWETVMAVGATNNQDNLAGFTTTGPEMSVTAPGVDVYSTWDAIFSPPYTYQSGTSMAAPHAAGVAALLWSYAPDLTHQQVWDIIEQTADDLGTPGWNPQFGHGRVNAHAALLAVTPLANDTCEKAIVVTEGVTEFSNVNAGTTGPEEPDDCTFFGDGNIQNDVWFVYEATDSGDLTIALCESEYAAKLGVYGATCPTGPGEVITCDLLTCAEANRPIITFPVSKGETFHLRIGGHNGATGQGVLEITLEPTDPTACPGDLTGDGSVGVSDLLVLVGSWGACGDPDDCPADLTGSGSVGVPDLLELIGQWGPCPN